MKKRRMSNLRWIIYIWTVFLLIDTVSCGWLNWGNWGSCSKTCGSGTKTRSRSCFWGGCSGSSTDSTSCNTHSCPVNGGWTNWGSWGSCSVSCAGGTKWRSRSCTNPSPSNGGSDCSGSTSSSTSCNTHSCPIDGAWGSWGSYGSCTLTCGGGLSYRYRSCNNPSAQHGGADCPNSDYSTQSCNTHNCPIDGGWSGYSGYYSCSVTCGGGVKYRYRYCNNPTPQYGGADCSGSNYLSATCNTHNCPIDGGWGTWGSWGSCPVTCGGGTKYRSRTCTRPTPQYGGADCSGSTSSSTSCNTHHCPIDGEWTSWTSWYSCSVTCGGGIQYKYRYCTNPAPQYGGADCPDVNVASQSCNTHNCPIDGYWNTWHAWQGCSLTCGTGIRYRTRVCDNPPPQYGGADCTDSDTDSINCNLRYCPTSTFEDCGNPSDGLLMYSAVNSLTSTLDNRNSYFYFMTGIAYDIDCCGLVQGWKFHPQRTGTIEFSVWSLVSGTTYQLKATQSVTLSSWDINADYSYNIPSTDRIAIIDTDRVAWRTTSSDIIPYYLCDDHNILWCPDVYAAYTTGYSLGQQIDISSGFTHTTTRAYSFKVYSIGNTPIDFTESLISTEIPDTTERMTSLYSYELTGVDTGEIPVFAWTGDTDYFHHNITSDTTGFISINKQFEAATVDATYQAVVEVEDSCSTGTVTFTVTVTDEFPSCGTHNSLMYKDPDLLATTTDTDSGFLYMMMDEVFDIKCCGVVSAWNFVPATTGTIDFVVFYHHSGNTYKIKSVNSYTVTVSDPKQRWHRAKADADSLTNRMRNFPMKGSNRMSNKQKQSKSATVFPKYLKAGQCFKADEVAAGAVVSYNISSTGMTLILNGDRVGWRCTGANIIKYDACDFSTDPECPNEIMKVSKSGTLTVDSSTTWTDGSGGVTTISNRGYAIEVQITNNTELSYSQENYFAKLDYRSSLNPVNTVLFTYEIFGVDVKDSVTWTFSDTYMKLDSSNFRIKLKKAFAAVSSISTYTTTLTAVDLGLSTSTTTFSIETYNMLDDCGYVPLLGYEDPSLYNATVDTGSGNMYLMKDDTYVVPCCGIISAWEFYPKAIGMLDFIVWKFVSGNKYKVKAFNTVEVTAEDVAANRAFNYTVASEFRIALEEYDRVGWRARTANIIASGTCEMLTNPYCLKYTLKADYSSTIVEDAEFQWDKTSTDVTEIAYFGYGFRAHSANNIPIAFSEEDYYAAVANHMPIGTSLMDYEILNIDYKEVVSISFTHYYMELNESYGFIQLKNEFQAIAFIETHSATMYISGSCDHTASVVFTIDAYNAPPIIRNLPRIQDIYEDHAGSQNLFFLDVFDPTKPPDPVCCKIESTKPQTANFEIQLLNGSDFYILTSEKPQFDYDAVNSYLLYVCCEDNYGTVRNYLQVDIKQRTYVELYSPPSWFYSSIIISLVPITIMLLMSCALLFHTLFFGR